jgi:predicted DNA-binding transcriptional regulator AlpA
MCNALDMSLSLEIPNQPRMIVPGDLIGSAEVCTILGVNRATVVRRAKAGTLPVIAQLDGPNGALVFDRADILAVAGK